MDKLFELEELINYESTILDYKIDMSVDINIKLINSTNRRNFRLNDLAQDITVIIDIGNKSFLSKMDRPFIHQIGIRIWKDEKTYIGVAMKWLEAINDSYENFPNIIKKAFYNKDLVIRYDPNKRLNIYGIVSTLYKPSNQLDFRDSFLKEAIKTKIIETTQSIIIKRKSGTIEERFKFNYPNQSIQLECSLIYGRNTGYNSYKVRWYRKTIEDNL